MSYINKITNINNQEKIWNRKKQNIITSETSTNNRLQNTSGPWAFETFTGNISQFSTDKPLDQTTIIPSVNVTTLTPTTNTNLDKLVNQFNTLLAEYTSQYKLMADQIMVNNNHTTLQKYANNNIKHQNNYYHVNEFGYAQAYDNDAWKNRSISCSSEPYTITDDNFNTLLGGPNQMGKGQACNIAGYNIMNSDTQEMSWVDIKGVKHIYPNNILEQRNPSCTLPPKVLTSAEYDAIVKGEDMTKDTFCEKLNVDPKILESLSDLNTQLLQLGTQILDTLHKQNNTDINIQELQNNINTKIKQLQNNNTLSNVAPNSVGSSGLADSLNWKKSTQSIEASDEYSNLILQQNYNKYIIGVVLVLFLIVVIFNIFLSDSPNVILIIVSSLFIAAYLYYIGFVI
jgi:hypothetical protein